MVFAHLACFQEELRRLGREALGVTQGMVDESAPAVPAIVAAQKFFDEQVGRDEQYGEENSYAYLYHERNFPLRNLSGRAPRGRIT